MILILKWETIDLLITHCNSNVVYDTDIELFFLYIYTDASIDFTNEMYIYSLKLKGS